MLSTVIWVYLRYMPFCDNCHSGLSHLSSPGKMKGALLNLLKSQGKFKYSVLLHTIERK